MKVYEVMEVWMEIVSQEHGQQITDREFGFLLSEGVEDIKPISRTTILQWRTGTHKPGINMLLDMYVYYHDETDWRFYWVCDMLRAIKPKLFDNGLINLPTKPFT